MKFYGRESELKTFSDQVHRLTQGSRLAVLTGRRRIGKTTLLLKVAQESALPYLYFFVQRQYSEQELFADWMHAVRERFHLNADDGPARPKLSSCIRYLLEKSKSQPLIVIIDECQELDFIVPFFWSELQQIWDLNKNSTQLFLVMSGSVASAIRHIFGDISAPLYGRCDLFLQLQPFQPRLLKEIYRAEAPKKSSAGLITLYALTGGVARYVEMLCQDTDLSSEAMLSWVCSDASSFYRADGSIVLANEFRIEAQTYFSLLRAIATGLNSWSELCNVVPGSIGPYLARLETQFHLVKKSLPLRSKPSARGVRYSIDDPYFRFWFRFIEPAKCRNLAERQDWPNLLRIVNQYWPQFIGRTLETWFLQSWQESGHWIEVGGWWDKKGEHEIDLIGINELDQKIAFAEVKRNKDKASLPLLQEKAAAFLDQNRALTSYEAQYKVLSLETL